MSRSPEDGTVRTGELLNRRGAVMTVRWHDDGRQEDVRMGPDATFAVPGTLGYEAFTDLDGLTARLESDPLPVFLQVLREYGPSLTATAIKGRLSDLRVEQAVLDKAWTRVQARLKKHDRIVVRGPKYKLLAPRPEEPEAPERAEAAEKAPAPASAAEEPAKPSAQAPPRQQESSAEAPADGSDDLVRVARAVIEDNLYLTLGTSEPDGRPRLSPLYFTHADYGDFYWVSSPEARHSRNLADRPEVSLVVYDSAAPIGEGRAVYMSADASVVPDDELPRRCAEAFARVAPGATAFRPHEVSGDAPLRLYRARVTAHEVHVRRADPMNGTGTDTRFPVTL